MRRLSALLLALAVPAAPPALAQAVVTSAGPDDVDVTLYRAPRRAADTPIDLEWLEGYALISETRRVTIPAGETEIRFEGVAGGIVPQSAIVTGFPDGIVERNRDAFLLSEASLLDRSLGRRVNLRRTSRATGAVTEQEAIIRSGADGAVVLQTRDGFEALRCTGQSEALVYSEVPAGLSARPTLSVRARSRSAVTATVTLSYLSNGFDWQANYVASLSADGSRIDLFAWLTLASMDETSFRNADTQAVAGRLNRADPDDEDESETEVQDWLELRCWAQGTTGFPDRGERLANLQGGMVDATVGDVLNELPALRSEFAQEQNIVVTAMRARQEELGDLKLYRIPEPVTVAANSQKQVAFLEQPSVQVRMIYRSAIGAGDDGGRLSPARLLTARNRREDGLGLPLPAGMLQLFSAGERPILLGEGAVTDRAVNEDVEVELGEATGVHVEIEEIASGRDWEDFVLTVTNDQSAPIAYEALLELDENERLRPAVRLGRRNGRPLWEVTVPANGSAALRYRIVERNR